jgi:hypothetical protein
VQSDKTLSITNFAKLDLFAQLIEK